MSFSERLVEEIEAEGIAARAEEKARRTAAPTPRREHGHEVRRVARGAALAPKLPIDAAREEREECRQLRDVLGEQLAIAHLAEGGACRFCLRLEINEVHRLEKDGDRKRRELRAHVVQLEEELPQIVLLRLIGGLLVDVLRLQEGDNLRECAHQRVLRLELPARAADAALALDAHGDGEGVPEWSLFAARAASCEREQSLGSEVGGALLGQHRERKGAAEHVALAEVATVLFQVLEDELLRFGVLAEVFALNAHTRVGPKIVADAERRRRLARARARRVQ